MEPGEAIDEYLYGLFSADASLTALLGTWQDGDGTTRPSVFNAQVLPAAFTASTSRALYPAWTFNAISELWILANGPQRCQWRGLYECHAIVPGRDLTVLAPILAAGDACMKRAPAGTVQGISPRDAARRVTTGTDDQPYAERIYRYYIWAAAS